MMNRRHWLAATGWALPLLGLGRHAGALAAARDLAAPGADYKALVCVFLFGGNDANQLVLPLDAAALAEHRRLRAPARLAFEPEQLAALPEADGRARFGLHPALQPLVPLWQRGRMALLFNTGALVEPLTRAAYLGRGARPEHLFSHADQQDFAQSLGVAPDGNPGLATGWGFRTARRLGLASPGAALPSLLSFNGNQRFMQGQGSDAARASLVLPSRGGFAMAGGGDAAAQARLAAFRTLWADAGSPIGRQAGDIVGSGLAAAGFANPILTGPSPLTTAAFSPNGEPLKSDVAQQLGRVARLLEARAAVGNRRQVFFVGMGGFDTHTNQANDQQRLFTDLGAALAAFHTATEALGIADRVTTFTLSDFARTLKANNSGGTDHGWGSHQIVLGGAVRGQRGYGRFPTLAAGGPDDAGSEGRWIPTTSYDQVAATLARWFGVDEAGLDEVAPNLDRFASRDLGFMA